MNVVGTGGSSGSLGLGEGKGTGGAREGKRENNTRWQPHVHYNVSLEITTWTSMSHHIKTIFPLIVGAIMWQF